MEVAVQYHAIPLNDLVQPQFAIHRSPSYLSHQPRTMSLADPYAHLSSTARRLAIKRAGFIQPQSTPNFAPDRQISTSPDPPKDQVVTLGTIDFGTIIRSINLIANQSSSHNSLDGALRRSTSPKSPSNNPSPLTIPSTQPQPFQFRFKVPVTPRPVHRLPLFHPHNTAPLPPIAQPTLIHSGPSSPPPRRASARARKPAPKVVLDDGLEADLQPATKRSHKRKSATTATVNAPSPLSNELARAPVARKRKADEEGRGKAKTKTTPAARPRKRLRSNSGSGGEKDDKEKEKTDEATAAEVEVESVVTAADDAVKEDRDTTMELESPIPAPSLPAVKQVPAAEDPKDTNQEDKGPKDADALQDEEDEEEVIVRRTINIFQEPPEPKPRPRPTYKNHLKRSSTSSFNGDVDKPSRPRKTRKNSSAGGSISISGSGSSSRKDSTEPKDRKDSTEPRDERPDSESVLMDVEHPVRQSPIPEEIMAQ